MPELPEVLVSAAVSLDGFLDDATSTRLELSSREDFAAVKRLRAEFDAIMVGAETIRRDNPSLRAADEDGPHPRKITITGSGDIDPASRFFTTGAVPMVFCWEPVAGQLRKTLTDRAEIHVLAEGAGLPEFLTALGRLGIRSLMVEGGSQVHTQFLTQGLADRLRLAVAPFFVGDGDDAPRFVGPGKFPHDKHHRMTLNQVEQLGDTAVLHYTLDSQAR